MNKCIKGPLVEPIALTALSPTILQTNRPCLKPPPRTLHVLSPLPYLNNYRPTTPGHLFSTQNKHQPHSWPDDHTQCPLAMPEVTKTGRWPVHTQQWWPNSWPFYTGPLNM